MGKLVNFFIIVPLINIIMINFKLMRNIINSLQKPLENINIAVRHNLGRMFVNTEHQAKVQQMKATIESLRDHVQNLESKLQQMERSNRKKQQIRLDSKRSQKSQLIEIIVRDDSTNKRIMFEVERSLSLGELRKYIEDQLDTTKFRFYLGRITLSKNMQKSKKVTQIMRNNAITISSCQLNFQKQASQNNPQNPIQIHTDQQQKPVHISKDSSSQLSNPIPYLWDQFQTQTNILRNYRKLTAYEIDQARTMKSIALNPERYILNHSCAKINLDVFLKFDWGLLQKLVMDNCYIDNKGLDLIAQKCHIFVELVELSMKRNKIAIMTMTHFIDFKELRILEIDEANESNPNPLTQISKQQMDALEFVQFPNDRKIKILRKK